MATSTLGLNQFTKGGQTSLLNSYNADMLKIDNGIAADRARLTAAEQAIADLPTGGYDVKNLLVSELRTRSPSAQIVQNAQYRLINIEPNTTYTGQIIILPTYPSAANITTKARSSQTARGYLYDDTTGVYIVPFFDLRFEAGQILTDSSGRPVNAAYSDEFTFTTPSSKYDLFTCSFIRSDSGEKVEAALSATPLAYTIYFAYK